MSGAGMGPIEQAVADDINALGEMVGVEPTLSEMARRVAREIDAASGECGSCGESVPSAGGAVMLPALNRELRATLKQLVDGRPAEDDDDDLADLDTPD